MVRGAPQAVVGATLPDLPILWDAVAALDLPLADTAKQRLRAFADLLVRRGGVTGTTAVTDIEGVQRRHLAEGLALADVLRDTGLLGDDTRIADIGSGGGLPGIPLAIVAPGASVTLIEATSRKAGFLREVVRALELERVTVVAERAETLGRIADQRESYDLAVSRAVAVLPALVELSLPLVRVGGRMVAIKGSRVSEEVAAAGVAVAKCGGSDVVVRPFTVPGGEQRLSVVIVTKASATPDTYPRRPGIPVKRPLGSENG